MNQMTSEKYLNFFFYNAPASDDAVHIVFFGFLYVGTCVHMYVILLDSG